jgi:hypothetical protein
MSNSTIRGTAEHVTLGRPFRDTECAIGDALIEWCQENAAIGKTPDEKTIREAVKKYGLDEIGVMGERGSSL